MSAPGDDSGRNRRDHSPPDISAWLADRTLPRPDDPTRTPEDSMIRADLVLHFFISLTLTFVLSMAFGPASLASVFFAVIVLGALRELAQWLTGEYVWAYKLARRWASTRWACIGQADPADMVANIFGVVVGSGAASVVMALWAEAMLMLR